MAQKQRRHEARTCVVCGSEFSVRTDSKTKTCKRACTNEIMKGRPAHNKGKKKPPKTRVTHRDCGWCGILFWTRDKGPRFTARFCSYSCSASEKNSRPEVKAAISEALRNRETRVCDECEKEFETTPADTTRFCSKKCSAKWRVVNKPISEEIRKANGRKAGETNTGRKQSKVARRNMAKAQLERFSRPEEIEKHRKRSEARRGQTWIGKRGGNGFTTKPQELLAKLTGLPMEVGIRTLPVKYKFESLPNVYKVDLADTETKLVVEVDGQSHRSRKWKFFDRRKTEVLNALGWEVVRYWNEEILEDPQKVADEISKTIELRRG